MKKSFLGLLVTLLICFGCGDKNGSITLETDDVTNIGRTTATCSGNISDDGGSSVSERGICWSTSSGPTTSDLKSAEGSGVVAFSCDMQNLSPNTKYYVRAYAVNADGTSYGNEVSFTTLPQPNSSFSCAVEGVAFNTVNLQVATPPSPTNPLLITAMSANKMIQLLFPEDVAVGTYPLNFGDILYNASYSLISSTDIFVSNTGSLVITEVNSATGKYKGTFEFKASNGTHYVNVTNGQFEVYK